jgi:dipeptidyl aminopeptidase/acylaminoacyl peptidase
MDDHVAAIKALAAKYRYMDTSRVGVYGGSGGGFAAAHAMFSSPDFYKVGVVDAGNHDQRGYLQSWGETYNGPEVGDNYKDASNARLAFGVRPEGKTIVDAR